MKATMILKNEHRVIERVLDCLERMAEQAEGEQRIPRRAVREAIDFFRHFADHCHHAKEEQQLFPLLESKGFSPTQGPTEVMRHEHVEGRNYIRGMSDALTLADADERPAVHAFVRHARGYVALLRSHIQKEDHCLFAMADQVLTEAEDASLISTFEHLETHDIGVGCHERYVHLAEKLYAEYHNVATASNSTTMHHSRR